MEDLTQEELIEFAETNKFPELVPIIEENELKGNALVGISRESIKEILGLSTTFGKIKNFEAFVRKLRQKYEPERLSLEEATSTPTNRIFYDSTTTINSSTTTPTTPANQIKKQWNNFHFKYPIERLKDDPVLDKLSMPEIELVSCDFTKICNALVKELLSYGDELLYPSEDQYTQADVYITPKSKRRLDDKNDNPIH